MLAQPSRSYGQSQSPLYGISNKIAARVVRDEECLVARHFALDDLDHIEMASSRQEPLATLMALSWRVLSATPFCQTTLGRRQRIAEVVDDVVVRTVHCVVESTGQDVGLGEMIFVEPL